MKVENGKKKLTATREYQLYFIFMFLEIVIIFC